MLSAWTRHLKSPKDKEEFERSLISNRWVLDRQTEILNEVEKDLDNSETSFKQYESPNWAYRQADINGFRRCLNLLKKLNNLDPKDEK